MTRATTHPLVVLLLLTTLFACSNTSKESTTWQTLDLMPHGFPISMLAPDSARVQVVRVGAVEDVSIQNEGTEHFSVQVFVQPALLSDISALKSNQINEVKSNPDFGRILDEDEQSFIYSLNTMTGETYSFRYVHLQADKEYVFTTGFNEPFSLKEVKRLLEAVKQ